MLCAVCGRELAEDWALCPYCGARSPEMSRSGGVRSIAQRLRAVASLVAFPHSLGDRLLLAGIGVSILGLFLPLLRLLGIVSVKVISAGLPAVIFLLFLLFLAMPLLLPKEKVPSPLRLQGAFFFGVGCFLCGFWVGPFLMIMAVNAVANRYLDRILGWLSEDLARSLDVNFVSYELGLILLLLGGVAIALGGYIKLKGEEANL